MKMILRPKQGYVSLTVKVDRMIELLTKLKEICKPDDMLVFEDTVIVY